ncbi:hypothetical protein V6N13_137895 [Hibiscus sabdariffa]
MRWSAVARWSTNSQKDGPMIGSHSQEMMNNGFQISFVIVGVTYKPVQANINRTSRPSISRPLIPHIPQPIIEKEILKTTTGYRRLRTTGPISSYECRIEVPKE